MGVVVVVVEPTISLYACWCLCDRSWSGCVVGEGLWGWLWEWWNRLAVCVLVGVYVIVVVVAEL